MTAHGQHTTHLMGSFPLQGGNHECCTMYTKPQIEWQSMNPRARLKSHQEQAKLKTIRKVKRQRHGTHTAKTRQNHCKGTAKSQQSTANTRQTHGKRSPRHGKRTENARQRHGKDTAHTHGKTTAKARQRHVKRLSLIHI